MAGTCYLKAKFYSRYDFLLPGNFYLPIWWVYFFFSAANQSRLSLTRFAQFMFFFSIVFNILVGTKQIELEVFYLLSLYQRHVFQSNSSICVGESNECNSMIGFFYFLCGKEDCSTRFCIMDACQHERNLSGKDIFKYSFVRCTKSDIHHTKKKNKRNE